MSDFDSSLPVRTENDGDVVIRVGDGTIPSQQLAVNSDGSINVTDNGGSLTVDAADLDIRDLDFSSDSVDVSGSSVTVSATDLDIRDLSAAQDNVAISDGTDTLEVNADGSLNAVVTATDLDIRDLDFASDSVDVSGSSVTVSATDLDIRDLDASQDSVSISDGSDTLEVNADGSLNAVVTATDLDIRDLSATQDSVEAWLKDATGTAFSASNPLPVSVAINSAGTEVNDFSTAASVAASGTSNHDYTAVGTFLLTQIEASGSGRMKIEVQVETGVSTDTFTTHFVQFNSTANPNMTLQLKSPIEVATGVRVRVIRTNRDTQSQDLYSTISGQET